MRILFVSAEVYPFAKVGGLADVAGSLPKYMARLGHEVQVVMPAYRSIENAHQNGELNIESTDTILDVPVNNTIVKAGVFKSYIPASEVPVYFIAKGDLVGRDAVYGYHDDDYRFSFFSRAALQLFVETLDWQPDMIHAHDWHTAPAITWLATAGQSDPRYRGIKSLFTIHNLAHHGKSDWQIFNYLQLYSHSLTEESYNEVNFMARGIYHSTKVNTVSPNYAQEIKTFQGGAGLDGLLRFRHQDLHGILNGLDYEVWDPKTDKVLAKPFDAGSIDQRAENKQALQRSLGLEENPSIPIIGMISRLSWQKGLDLMGEVVYRLMEGQAGRAQMVVLGSGEHHYEEMFGQFASRYPGMMSATFQFKPDLARMIYGGADMFFMPSLFEPCGLGQLIAMRYGNIPIVRATGGLADTVEDAQTGFVFDGYDTDSFWVAVQRAMYTFNTDQRYWRTMQTTAMQKDFSWDQSAKEYEQLYQWTIS
ncbi:MAG: glycogen synthase [Chloroflexota bacterium]